MRAFSNPWQRVIGMVRSPRETLTIAVMAPRTIDVAIVILVVAAACNSGFLMTRVGQLAALDQQVRQLESFGFVVDDKAYTELRRWLPYRPAISAGIILIGWPLIWVALAAIVKGIGRQAPRQPAFSQVLTVVVHASVILALRQVVAVPVNYARESIGGATSLDMVMPAFGESTFMARLLGAIDLFVVWWVVLVAMGLGILYETRVVPVARWLLCAYAAGAVVLAITQALRGGV
jgi:hypothetical protein